VIAPLAMAALAAVAGATPGAQAPRADTTVVVLLGTGMPRPDPAASGPATAVVVGRRVFLVDAGSGVERQLAAEGKTRFDLGREAFVERVWAYVRTTGSTILDQLRAIGCSCDWTRTRFTLDPAMSRAVRETFVRLWEEGLIYRGYRVIHWCPRCHTALSDEEAEHEDVEGAFYHIRYPLADAEGHITVATTRPETLAAVSPGSGVAERPR
jgi:hypothetical protein